MIEHYIAPFYLNSKAETTLNKSDIDDVFESTYSTIISNIQNSLGQGSSWLMMLLFQNIISYLVPVISNYHNFWMTPS